MNETNENIVTVIWKVRALTIGKAVICLFNSQLTAREKAKQVTMSHIPMFTTIQNDEFFSRLVQLCQKNQVDSIEYNTEDVKRKKDCWFSGVYTKFSDVITQGAVIFHDTNFINSTCL